MTQTNVRVQMQIRRDTAANWSNANPTPLAGELCYETDTGKIKVGTGSDAWVVLPYAFLPLSGGSLTDHLTIHNKKELRLSDATANTAGDHYSAFKAGTQSADLTYTLPTALPTSSGQVLSCTDAGVMSWATDSPGMATTGGTFTGDVTFNGDNYNLMWDKSENHLKFANGALCVLGSDSDLVLKHDSANSYIYALHSGAGDLYIDAQGGKDLYFRSGDGSTSVQNAIVCTHENKVALYYDGEGPKLETTSTGIKIKDSTATVCYTELATSSGTAGYIEGSGTTIVSLLDAQGHFLFKGTQDAESILYYNNLQRVTTSPYGAIIGPHASGDTWIEVRRSDHSQQVGLIIQDKDTSSSDSRDWYIYQTGNDYALNFYMTGVNRRRGTFTELGYFKAGDTMAWTDTTTCHELTNSAGNWTLQPLNNHSTQPHGIQIYFPGRNTGSDDASNNFINCHDNTAARFRVFGSGDTENQNNSYSAVSDIKLKENIVDASSQWDDIKNIKVRNFNFKTNPSKKLLGVVAQEIETISPGLVNETVDKDADNNDLGTTTKSVRYSILYMKAIKALQEAMGRIEVLETEVATLKG